MRTKHTPGPWIYQDEAIRQADSGAIVAEIGPVFGSRRLDRIHANANLISAAPELLAALEMSLKYIPIEDAEVMWAARSAIAKAKGE